MARGRTFRGLVKLMAGGRKSMWVSHSAHVSTLNVELIMLLEFSGSADALAERLREYLQRDIDAARLMEAHL